MTKLNLSAIAMMVFWLATPSTVWAVDASRMFQTGMYLQHTMGDLDAALESYRGVLLANPKPELEERALLRLGECLEWAGRSSDIIEVVAKLDKTAPTQADRLGPVRHFPAGLDLIMQMDVRRLHASRLMDLLGAEMDIEAEQMEQLVAALGIDPRKDLHRLSLGLELGPNEDFPLQRFVAHVEGNLSKLVDVVNMLKVAKLVGQTQAKKAKPAESGPASGDLERLDVRRTTVAGHSVQVVDLPVAEAPGGKLTLSVVRLDDNNMLLGMGGAVEDTLRARAGRSVGLRADEALKRMVDRLPAGRDMWMLASPRRLLDSLAKLDADFQVPLTLPVLTGMLLCARFADELELMVATWAEDKESAQEVTDLARGGLALLRLVALAEDEMPAEAKKIVREMNLVTEGQEIRLQTSVPWSLLEADGKTELRLGNKQGKSKKIRVQVVP